MHLLPLRSSYGRLPSIVPIDSEVAALAEAIGMKAETDGLQCGVEFLRHCLFQSLPHKNSIPAKRATKPFVVCHGMSNENRGA